MFPLRSLAFSTALVTLSAPSLAAQESDRKHGDWKGTVGVVVGSLPSYYGSDARRTLGVPLIGLDYKNRVLIGTSSGSGLGGGIDLLLKRGIVGASLGVAGIESRPEDHANGLAGMDDRSGSVFGTVGLSVRVGPASATANTAIGLDPDAGVMQSLGLRVGGAVAPRVTASIGGAATFADRDNMTFDFGITEQQAARRRVLIAAGDGRLRASDTAAYAPKSGFKELRGTAQVTYAIRGAWQAVGLVSAGRLARDISESPLARKRSAITSAVGFAYGF